MRSEILKINLKNANDINNVTKRLMKTMDWDFIKKDKNKLFFKWRDEKCTIEYLKAGNKTQILTDDLSPVDYGKLSSELKKIYDTSDSTESETTTNKKNPNNIIVQQRGGCCALGLIPTLILFLPFMFVYPNKNILLSIINFHKKRTSPMLNKLHFNCQFTPSCSEYSRIVIKKYGVVKGGFKSIYRLMRCNPFNKNKGDDYP